MKHLLSFLLLLATLPLAAQPIPIRVCTYNVLKYGGKEVHARAIALKTVLEAVEADIVAIQGLSDIVGIDAFKKAMLSPRYRIVTGSPGPDSGNGLMFSDAIQGMIHWAHPTALRYIDEYVLHVKETTDTIHVFICHLKAGDTPADREARRQEALILRQLLDKVPRTRHSIVAGDLNVYSASETAYTALTTITADPSGGVRDPNSSSGDWHNNGSFAHVHTNSTRLRSFDSGSSGGMVNRFDFVLLSPSLLDGEYESGSYITFGNDGQHFNDSINAGTNLVVSQTMAQTLHDASDHLPVYLKLKFQRQSSGVESGPALRGKEMDLSDAAKKE